MKTTQLLVLGILICCSSPVLAAKAQPRVVSLHVEKLADGTHWMPKEIEVKQGEEIIFELTDKLEGMPLHGFTIEKLGIKEMVELNKTKKLPAKKIDLAPGNYDITCQFHPAHVKATLVVKPDPNAKTVDTKNQSKS